MSKITNYLRQYKLLSLAVITVLLGLGLYISNLHTAARWVVSVVALLETLPLLRAMVSDVRAGNYGIDILAVTAIVVSVVLGQYWAAIVIVLMMTGGASLEDYAENRAKSELRSLLSHVPLQAHLVKNRKTVRVSVSTLRSGDKILIKPGEIVPVDAVIIEGSASFDESSLTGESLPVAKSLNDVIISGSLNLDGAITARASASAEDSQYQQIIKLVRNASASRAPFVRLAERYSLPFTVAAFAIAGAVWAVSGDPIRFLEVIVVATPCPLLLAAPIALISGMSRASKYGIIVKTGSAMERLAEVQTIAFDKTGTLTSGALKVLSVKTFANYSQAEVLRLSASLEKYSNHVVAEAIITAAEQQTVRLTKVKHVQEISGRGLAATLGGQQILVGRLSLLQERAVTMPAKYSKNSTQHTAVYVAVDGQLAGIISFSDEVRPESKTTLLALKKLGISHTLLVTGDNRASAQAIADELGIQEVHAEMLPADKMAVIEGLTKRPVAFVGDGVNDAPVLTAADIGIALGARGSTAASESADMVLLHDDLSRVASAVSIAKRTFSIARQSILIGIGLSLILMAVYATGKFSPLSGALLQELVDVAVIFNALRAHSITSD